MLNKGKDTAQAIYGILTRTGRPLTVRELYASHLRHLGTSRQEIQAALDDLVARDQVHGIQSARTIRYQVARSTRPKAGFVDLLERFRILAKEAQRAGLVLTLAAAPGFMLTELDLSDLPSPTPEASKPSQGLSEGSGDLSTHGHITEDDTSIF